VISALGRYGVWLALLCLSSLGLSSCEDPSDFAPVVESRWTSNNKNQTNYTVQSGDTLYAVAFRYDKDYRQLARYNRLTPPYHLRVGQILHLQYPSPVRVSHVVNQPHRVRSVRQSLARTSPRYIPQHTTETWSWPANGRIVSNYFPSHGKKGIDIAGNKGEPVYAAASGVVAYSGSGISGYGNLIIIKHSGQYLTAYGYNARNLVREGQHISKGQRIAEMGVIDRRFFGVHFEIRQAGQPVNPLTYLRRRSTKVN